MILKFIILVPGANEWGKKRVDFYVNSTSRVREDGILNEEEQEMLELEEEDAVERQRKLDSINSVLDYKKLGAFVDDSSDEYEDESSDDSVEQQKPTKIGRITLTKRKDPPPIREFSSDEDDESKKTTRIQLGKRQGPSQNQRKGKVKFVEGWEEEAKSVEKEERRKINYEVGFRYIGLLINFILLDRKE